MSEERYAEDHTVRVAEQRGFHFSGGSYERIVTVLKVVEHDPRSFLQRISAGAPWFGVAIRDLDVWFYHTLHQVIGRHPFTQFGQRRELHVSSKEYTPPTPLTLSRSADARWAGVQTTGDRAFTFALATLVEVGLSVSATQYVLSFTLGSAPTPERPATTAEERVVVPLEVNTYATLDLISICLQLAGFFRARFRSLTL